MNSISLITLSQYRRLPNLFILKDLILEQTYLSKITEWVIVDGSKEKNTDMSLQIQKLQESIPQIPIVFVDHEEGAKIGRLRNKGNNTCKGDLIVCMDDDDYYPPQRVEEAFKKLTKPPKTIKEQFKKLNKTECLIAGCSGTFMYDFVLDKQYKFHMFGDTHAPNNTMAFKRKYLVDHKHDETVSNAEETSFTNTWTEPMAQLDSLKTINVSSHSQNTFNKRQLVISYYYGHYKHVEEFDKRMLPQNYYERMRSVFIHRDVSPYDIVYFCGQSIEWNPNDESLGGSEQAVKYLSQEWVKSGKTVAVYGSVPNGIQYKGVDYFHWLEFPYNEQFDTLVAWRLLGLICLNFVNIKAKTLLWDLHDNMKIINQTIVAYNKMKKNTRPFDKIMFKSQFHKTEFECIHPKLAESEYCIIPNGLRIAEFAEFDSKITEQRNPYRFCYCSSYSRGLINILRFVWTQIVKIEPRAELHVYYGMDREQEEFKKIIHQLLGVSKNVMDHGREPLDMVVREKHLSTYQLYLTDHPAEIDCINIREGLLCGCIPIISDTGIFKEREGIQIKVDFTDPEKKLPQEMAKAGNMLGQMLKNINAETLEGMRQKLKESKLIIDWKLVADYWLELKNYIH